ncbi:MAG: type 1 glutamine amidotransferase domain-containing protein [Bacteroidales bacterium]
MAKIIVFLEDLVEDSEFLYPYMRFKEEGHDVISVAPKNKTYKGKAGMSFQPDHTFDEVKTQTFDLVFVPGGYAPDQLRRHEDITGFIKNHYDQGKLVASVCHGPWVLISAGIVKGKKVTGFHAIKDDLINAGAHYQGNDTEEDGNLFTCTNPNTLLIMMKRLVEKLKS